MPTHRSFTARLVVAVMAVTIAILGGETAAAAPLPFPFTGSGAGQPGPLPPTSDSGAFFDFYATNASGGPATVVVSLVSSECAFAVDPPNDWYKRTIENGEQTQYRFSFRFSESNPLCVVSSTNATWLVETQTARGKDSTTIRFRSYQGDNTLQWRQTTTAGQNPVFIDRLSDGLKFNIR